MPSGFPSRTRTSEIPRKVFIKADTNYYKPSALGRGERKRERTIRSVEASSNQRHDPRRRLDTFILPTETK